ncbi:MAG: hypothetical protein MZV64_13965 [Ignavibacteriales bacterium]|nr:hypothetical protein [Ignavibacteriales bacterium]
MGHTGGHPVASWCRTRPVPIVLVGSQRSLGPAVVATRR